MNLNRFPSVDKRPLDLYRLKKAVEARGGFEKVCKQKKWAEIGRDLGYSGKIMSSLSTSLKNSYQKWLQPYEEYLRIAKPGVYQQLEFENGGPYTPSPGPSPMKKAHQGSPNGVYESPAARASAALNASLLDATPPVPEATPPRAPVSSGFTAVNAGGFTAVNAQPMSSSFSAVNHTNSTPRDSDTAHSTPQPPSASPLASATGTPDIRPSALGSGALSNGQAFGQLKRHLSQDEDSAANGDSDAAGRRSKRLKKGTVALHHSQCEASARVGNCKAPLPPPYPSKLRLGVGVDWSTNPC